LLMTNNCGKLPTVKIHPMLNHSLFLMKLLFVSWTKNWPESVSN